MILPLQRVAVLGLGAAGLAYAEDLSERVDVVGFDPVATATDAAFEVAASAAAAVEGAQLVLALTPAAAAETALASCVPAIAPGTLYADMSTGSPQQKVELAEKADAAGIRFIDAVVMAPVAHRRSATPLMASGEAASVFAELVAPLGLPVEVIDGPPGAAAARKLLRSIVVKGLTAVLIEGSRAAEEQGLLDWFGDHASETLSSLTPDFLRGLLDGTAGHSERRVHEMGAAVSMVEVSGSASHMARATMDLLAGVGERGIPRGGALA